MKVLVIGTREDVAGFALAGVEGVACETREEAERVLARADAETLVLLHRGHDADAWESCFGRRGDS